MLPTVVRGLTRGFTSLAAPNPAARPPSRVAATSKPPEDRYAALLRRIEELEKVHADEKRQVRTSSVFHTIVVQMRVSIQHQADYERCKSQATRLMKANAEQSERLEKLKKQNEAYNSRVQELKKASAAEQTELKEMRIKLRMSEHERAQLAGKQGEMGEVRRALQALESKRREEVRERDQKIVDLEKTVAAERKKREMLESCVHHVKAKADEEAAKLRNDVKSLQSQLTAVQEGRQAVSVSLTQAASREEELVVQLEQCKVMLSRVAVEYGRLASTTILRKTYEAFETVNTQSKMHTLRLERKLGNAEDQVAELAHLIRQSKEENMLLRQQLAETEEEMAFYAAALRDRTQYVIDQDDDTSKLTMKLAFAHNSILEDQLNLVSVANRDNKIANDLYSLRNDKLAHELEQERIASKTLSGDIKRHLADRVMVDTQLSRLEGELTEANHALVKEQLSLADAQQTMDKLQEKLDQVEQQLGAEITKHREAEEKGREVVKKLSVQLSMSKTAEEVLNAEIKQLHVELADVVQFQDAYYKLVEETEDLLARNNLAEEEAERLGKFNAEILGHHNPAQRIVYVDRIRRELSETKQVRD
ncbi:hypothetical protein ID866_4454 [Astraeus odoratus]|nr:hypothetical protein ID866_4454 [Astraeus odoratus]